MVLVCPICRETGIKSKVRFIGQEEPVVQLWDYDENGRIIEREINVLIECDRGHKTSARLKGELDKAKQI